MYKRQVQDATVYDPDSEQAADIVIADVPCSGYGVIGKKPEIKYRATPQKQEEIVMLQRMKMCIRDRRSGEGTGGCDSDPGRGYPLRHGLYFSSMVRTSGRKAQNHRYHRNQRKNNYNLYGCLLYTS